MRDPIDAVRIAYRTLLTSNVSGNYGYYDDIAVQSAPYPYVILSAQSAPQVKIGQCHYYRSTMQIRIVTVADGSGVGSRLQSGVIAGEIIRALSENSINPFGFRVIESTLKLNFSQNPYSDGQRTYRERVLMYEDLLEEYDTEE